MTDARSRSLRAAALGFACATAYNSVVAIRNEVPGEPLGLRVPLSLPAGIVAGWGSAVAAPWPMPVAALVAAHHRTKGEEVVGPARVCAGLGVAGIIGILIEPNTYQPQAWTPAVRRALVAHVMTSATLAGVGFWHLHRPRRAGQVRTRSLAAATVAPSATVEHRPGPQPGHLDPFGDGVAR